MRGSLDLKKIWGEGVLKKIFLWGQGVRQFLLYMYLFNYWGVTFSGLPHDDFNAIVLRIIWQIWPPFFIVM